MQIGDMRMETRSISGLPMIRRMGRTTETDGRLNLFWTASGADFCFRGAEIHAAFTSCYSFLEQWISVEADGCFLLRMPLPYGKSEVCLLRGLDRDVIHRIRIFKEVQVMSEDPDSFLSLDDLIFDGEVLAPPESALTLEFIGDSITSGEGTFGQTGDMEQISPFFGVENNYALMTADSLNAKFSCISQSGWGLVSDYHNNPFRVLPPYYEKVCGVASGKLNIAAGAHDLYDFLADPSDFVIINLGTNDEGAFHEEPWIDPETGDVFSQSLDEFGNPSLRSQERIRRSAVNFLKKLRQCNPGAQMIWCYGMLGNLLAHDLAGAVASYQSVTGDSKAHFLLLPPVREGMYGSRMHPGRPAHEAAAGMLTAYIRQLRG